MEIKIMKLKERIEKLHAFRNNAMCRFEANQITANKLLDELQSEIDPQDNLLLRVELTHYYNGELSIEDFGDMVKKIIKQYEDYYEKLGTNC
jgi:RNA binding exosome subunit